MNNFVCISNDDKQDCPAECCEECYFFMCFFCKCTDCDSCGCEENENTCSM